MKLKRYFYIIMFFAGLTLFTFSLLPFFRLATDTFWVATVVGAAVSLLSVVGLLYKPKEKVKLSSKYERKKELMTKPEREFLDVLRRIAPEKYEVVPQVALASVIDKKTNASYRTELFRICDYCFIDRITSEPLVLVELNDSSHRRPDRRARDEKVAAICEDAGIALVTFDMSDDSLDFSSVKRAVLRAMP